VLLRGELLRAGETRKRMARVAKKSLSTSTFNLALFGVWIVVLLMGSPAISQELRLVTSPWPPSNYLDDEGQPTGLSVAIIDAIKDRLGLSTPIEVIPWARGYKIAQSEPNILLFTAARTPEREEMGFTFIAPAVMWTHGLLAKKDSGIDIQSLEGARLQGLTAVGVRGSWQVKLLQEAGIDTVEADDQETCARMLLAGRVDVWITSQLQASVVLENIDAEQSSVEPVFIHRRSPSYLMVSNGTDPQLLKKWQDAFDELKNSGALHKVAEEWSEQLGIPLIYDPEEGFSAKNDGFNTTG
jgi:polar amino acid transport system substrate-binding protein